MRCNTRKTRKTRCPKAYRRKMMYANQNGMKIKAEPEAKGQCPICEQELIPKCGSIKIWHWSHKNLVECDNWSEGESEWHLGWKKYFQPDQVEVKMENHRADIVNKSGIVVELQASSISPYEILIRERFYGKMIWLFYLPNAQIELREKKAKVAGGKDFVTFRWKHPSKTVWGVSKLLFIDIGWGRILFVKKVYDRCPCGGWGYVVSKWEFLRGLGVVVEDGA